MARNDNWFADPSENPPVIDDMPKALKRINWGAILLPNRFADSMNIPKWLVERYVYWENKGEVAERFDNISFGKDANKLAWEYRKSCPIEQLIQRLNHWNRVGSVIVIFVILILVLALFIFVYLGVKDKVFEEIYEIFQPLRCIGI